MKTGKCRECLQKKSSESDIFCLQEIVSSQELNDLPSNSDGRLFSNPSFTHGFLSDIEFVVPPENNGSDCDTDDTLTENNHAVAETFSLIKLVTSIVKREMAPIQKELQDAKNANKLLEEEIQALKAERDAVPAEGSATPTAEQMNSVLAPYKNALEKIIPIEQSLAHHQRYLDQDDAKKREMNIIITGVKESTEDTTGENDATTVKDILLAAGCGGDVVPTMVRRLGRRSDDQTRNRPLLVVTDSAKTRKKILQKKSNLKNHTDERFKTIYIKADEPLAVRREWKRLKDAMKKEKQAPTNVGLNIRIDYKTRKLLRDGTVIDEFKSPFPKRGPNL